MPKIFYGIFAAILVLIVIFFFTKPSHETPPISSEDISSTEPSTDDTVKTDYPTLVLDAGHGGFDPGKVGVNGALEKDINLSIVLKLQKILEDKGFTIYLTRNSDDILAKANSTSPKKEDMINRVDFIAKYNPAFTISIHQNSFTDPASSGPQTFYHEDSAESAALAKTIQDVMNDYLKPQKQREPQANKNYYLLTRTPTPTVIVECGFLSNPSEADLLVSDEYQTKVAHAISLGIISYLETNSSNQIPSE